MANPSSMYVFDLALSDVDRGVYATLSIPVARHPSEAVEYLVARVLAYALEYEEGIAFAPGGLSTAGEPALSVRDLTGRRTAWIEVGTPDAERLHKASKQVDRVAVYCHKDVDAYLRSLAGQRIHGSERVAITGLDRAFVATLVDRLDRRNGWTLTVSDGQLYVEAGGESMSLPLVRRPPS